MRTHAQARKPASGLQRVPLAAGSAPGQLATPTRVRQIVWGPRLAEGVLQRKCARGQSSGGGECEECGKEKQSLQRREGNATEPAGVPPIVHEVLRSSGQPLDGDTRAFMEPRFAHDFSGVRVHTGARAAESATSVNALAYTVGQNVVFGEGQYRPGAGGGNKLLAHELTHVVQQGGRGATPTRLSLARADSAEEAEADHASEIVASGTQLPPTQSEPGFFGDFGGGRFGGGGSGGTIPSPLTAGMPPISNIKVWFNAFIPQRQINGPPGHACFRGDDRSFSSAIHASSRSHQEIEFDAGTLAKSIDWKETGTTHEINCTTGAVLGSGRAPVSQLTNGSVVASGSEILVDFQEAATNPLVSGAPAIDAEVVFHIDPLARRCHLTGAHDGFPAYEAYVTANGGAGVLVYSYDPVAAGEGISALFPPMDKTVTGARTRF